MADTAILVLAAVEREMEPLRRRLERLPPPYSPRFILTGAGKISAACETTLAILEFSPALAIQAGCAGALGWPLLCYRMRTAIIIITWDAGVLMVHSHMPTMLLPSGGEGGESKHHHPGAQRP